MRISIKIDNKKIKIYKAY